VSVCECTRTYLRVHVYIACTLLVFVSCVHASFSICPCICVLHDAWFVFCTISLTTFVLKKNQKKKLYIYVYFLIHIYIYICSRTLLICLPFSMTLCRVCMPSSLPVCQSVFRALQFLFSSIFITTDFNVKKHFYAY